ncbi:unnamed protein product [Trichogramma brassicae]|uniref:Uncharacterized protein n=1 Tax=Trichogramma brassicae TaxID=86971 RepID=A0A6H5IJG6_9HYME|nr:unnamed protein product [Trichogramma brassicae]
MAVFFPKRGQLYARYQDCDAKGHCDGFGKNFGIMMIDTREPTRSTDIVRTGTFDTYSMSAFAVNEHDYRIYWITDRYQTLHLRIKNLVSLASGINLYVYSQSLPSQRYMCICAMPRHTASCTLNRVTHRARTECAAATTTTTDACLSLLFLFAAREPGRGDVKSRRTKPRRASTCTHIVFSLSLFCSFCLGCITCMCIVVTTIRSSSSSFKRKREKEEVSSWRTTCSLVTTLWIRELGAWTVYAMMVNVPRCEHTLRARLLYVISSTCAPHETSLKAFKNQYLYH